MVARKSTKSKRTSAKKPKTAAKQEQQGAGSPDPDQSLAEEIYSGYEQAHTALAPQRAYWPTLENIGLGRLNMSAGGPIKSRVSEGTLANMIWEASSRELAQPPSGQFKALIIKNRDANKLANTIFPNWIVPNSNAQYRHASKLRLLNLYRKIYGAMPIIHDMVYRPNYVGPDFWIVSPYHYAPQSGRLTFSDVDDHFVSTFHSPLQLREMAGKGGNDKAAIERLLDKSRDTKMVANNYKSQQRTSTISQEKHPDQGAGTPMIELVTRYRVGKNASWHTIAIESEDEPEVIRTKEQSLPSGGVPVKLMHSLPLLDTIMGLGEAEMNESMQKAIDTLVNLGLDAGKYGLFPPTIINPDKVNRMQVIWRPAAVWEEGESNSIRQFPVSSSAVNTMQNLFQHLKGAMLARNATTDTTISVGDDPQQGKTPQALKQQQQREFARDIWSREMMEETISELYEDMYNQFAFDQDEAFTYHLFEEEIKKVAEFGTDGKPKLELAKTQVKFSDDGDLAEVTVDGGAQKLTRTGPDGQEVQTSYKYFIDPGSTLQEDMEDQFNRLDGIVERYAANREVLDQSLMMNDRKFDVGQAFLAQVNAAGVKDADKIVPKLENDEKQKMLTASTAQPPRALPAVGPDGQPQPQTGVTPPAPAPATGQPAPAPAPAGPAPGDPEVSAAMQQIADRFRRSSPT